MSGPLDCRLAAAGQELAAASAELAAALSLNDPKAGETGWPHETERTTT